MRGSGARWRLWPPAHTNSSLGKTLGGALGPRRWRAFSIVASPHWAPALYSRILTAGPSLLLAVVRWIGAMPLSERSRRRGRHTLAPDLCRQARELLGWDRRDLAVRALVSSATVANLEEARFRPTPATCSAIRAALEAAGVEFIAENGAGAGVRLRKTAV
ncbi:helix-turn-helix domain-containing protein [Roseomonas chloroacetimidivorans]|uniref:helix-turn-helix domain-containing protein n=1 Tax=Roseomonas chloroacetimidivorans TaxID=1766656 RepID=UPI003C742488